MSIRTARVLLVIGGALIVVAVVLAVQLGSPAGPLFLQIPGSIGGAIFGLGLGARILSR